jgi:cell division septation protein DedD
MRNNETGEFELVVGNKQLLSGFAIVVLLFGVGVAMGYILGQNAPRSAKLQQEATAAGAASAADSRPQPAAPVAPAVQQQPATPATDAGGAAPPTDSAEPPAQPPAQAAPPQPTTQPAREVTASAPPALPIPAAAPGAVPEAPPGNYWQVMALPQADAEGVMRTLKDQGFPALLSPGTKNLTRVLVGPFADTTAMGRAKTQLEKAGFHPVKKSSE